MFVMHCIVFFIVELTAEKKIGRGVVKVKVKVHSPSLTPTFPRWKRIKKRQSCESGRQTFSSISGPRFS
jgi:hypothetical protein